MPASVHIIELYHKAYNNYRANWSSTYASEPDEPIPSYKEFLETDARKLDVLRQCLSNDQEYNKLATYQLQNN